MKKHTARKVFNVITTVFLIVIIAVVIFIFIARISGGVPSIFGYSVFRVSSDSMTPTLQVNDIILTKRVAADEIQVGDIVTYDSYSGETAGYTVTHRVVEEPTVDESGVYRYRTQGDKEGAMLDKEISYSQIEGKYVCTIPLMDKIYTFFLSPYGLIAFIFIIVVLFGYEVISLILSYKALDEKDDSYYAPPNKKPSKKRKK